MPTGSGEVRVEGGTVSQGSRRVRSSRSDLFTSAGRRLVSFLSSYRLRLLAWFVILLGLGTAVTVAVVGEVLLQGTEERIRRDLVQESEEFRSLAGGIDPATGEAFGEDVERIFEVFLDRNVPARNEVILTFVDGELFRRSRPIPRYELGQDPVFIEAVANIPAVTTGSISSPVGSVDYLALPVLIEDQTRGVFAVAAFRDLERAEQDEILRAVATVGVVLLVIGTVLAWRLADRVLAPVRRTAATARSISETDLSQRVEVRGHDEVAALAETFNEMLDRVSVAFDEQRRFMDDAGHELRTPLTIARGHLELFDEESPDDRRRTVDLVLDEVDRMTLLVNELLVLASASRPDFARRTAIQAVDLMRTVFDKARVLGDRQWRFEPGRDGTIWVDRQRMTQAVLQLAHNAVRHTSATDVIALGANVDQRSARLWVRDTGSGIAEHEQKAIFERFYRSEGSSRASDSGVGLGLSIVRAIAEAHEGRVALTSRPGEGASFTVVIPHPEGRTGATHPNGPEGDK